MELSVIKLLRFVRVCLRAELANIVNWVGEASKFYKIKFPKNKAISETKPDYIIKKIMQILFQK